MVPENRNPQTLFGPNTTPELRTYLANVTKSCRTMLGDIPDDEVLALGEAGLIDLIREHAVKAAPSLDLAKITVADKPATFDAPGQGARLAGGDAIERWIRYRFLIPFQGDRQAFRGRAGKHKQMGINVATLGENEIEIVVEVPQHSGNAGAEQALYAHLDEIEERLNWATSDIRVHNETIERECPRWARDRYASAGQAESEIASIRFPLKQDNATMGKVVPLQKRSIRARSSPNPSPFADEQLVTDDDYEAVLEYLALMRTVIERNPRIFGNLQAAQGRTEEEIIRDFFLVLLNTGFPGEATGETFNNLGKTDILVRAGNRNVFIGECKFWDGPDSLTEAVNQMLGYPAWRDTKAGLLIFIKDRKNITRAIETAQETLRNHPSVLQSGSIQNEYRYDVVMSSPIDADRRIKVAMLPYVIPAL